jgi:phage terminase large subunit GpA-like protein
MAPPAVDALVARTILLWRPPPRLSLPDWAEKEFRLSERSSAQPGKFRLWKYQRGWLDAIGDPAIPRVTLIKAARVGFSKCLMATIGGYAANNPCSVILLVPTDDDTRRYAVDEIEPSFDESPILRPLIKRGRLDGRNTLVMKAFAGGGSLKILAARSPRNLRSHDAKVLLIDEADAMDVTAEGDPISLAEKRTLAHPDRKIVVGSTPTVEGISLIERLYGESDQRVFEVPCPKCGTFKEILWQDIRWPDGEPEKAAFYCQNCDSFVDERYKATMVADGEWRATSKDAKSHAGFRINALVSLFANASWGLLAQEFLKAKRAGPVELQVFANTVEGRVWKTSLDSLDETAIMQRAESWSLSQIPSDILAITAGIDVQNDRLEITILGWSQTTPFVLGHLVIWGSTLDDTTWAELDELLRSQWPHPRGWRMRVDAAAVDTGGTGTGPESRTQQVYNFCGPRLSRRIYAVKGLGGPQQIWRPSKKSGGVRLFIVGVDQLKAEIMERLAAEPFLDSTGAPCAENIGCGRNPSAMRISADLPDEWFEQVTAERRFIRYVRRRAVIEFRPIRSGIRNEGLDCLVYAIAARRGVRIDFDKRKAMGEPQVSRSDGPAAKEAADLSSSSARYGAAAPWIRKQQGWFTK